MDKWDDLKFVLAVATYGSLSAAARGLSVNHSTVSRRLAGLEARIGTRLFERLPDGLSPTPAGTEAVESARRIEAELHALDTRITAQDAELDGPLRVTAAQLIFQAGLADIMARFKERHPRIELSMNAANEILSLTRREADVAIRVTDRPDEGLFGRLATGQSRGFYGSKAFLREHAEALLKSDGPEVIPCVSFKWWGKEPPKAIRARFPNAYTSVVCDDMIALHAAVRAGMGIGRMPCFLGDPDPDLERVPGFELSRYFDIWVLTHPDLKNVERIRQFMRFAADEFKANSGLYLGR
ncbi:LysR family transcriptional regulator [Roseibium algae]|uniref:LysR family transcriptional regulator n=1 Tax=Roseibium algae TaxID=3123038 RepID=A0ABU8TIL6_9HYPH